MSRFTRFFSDAASNALFHWCEIADVVEHGEHFRSIRLRGTELQGRDWNAGDKVQIRLDGLTLRTYTPTSWDAKAGTMSLLGYCHGGTGPGDAWVRHAEPGVRAQLFGPRKSVRLEDFESAPVFVGDETSFGLSLAWRTLHSNKPAVDIFEVNDAAASSLALKARGIEDALLIERLPGNGHIADLRAAVATAAAGRPLCLTGKVQTIAMVRDHLKSTGVSSGPTKAKAYWDENRSGLD